jgi:hypothetical protein
VRAADNVLSEDTPNYIIWSAWPAAGCGKPASSQLKQHISLQALKHENPMPKCTAPPI